MNFGANTWIWTSPLTTEELETLVPKVVEMGFDWIELPIEGLNDFNYARAGKLTRDHGLGVSLVAAMGEERDLIHPDSAIRESGMTYVRHCLDAAQSCRRAPACRPALLRRGPHLADDGRGACARYGFAG